MRARGQEDNVKHLWHGTSGTNPKMIMDSQREGFDSTYASEGLWGRGIYTAVNAKYSDDYRHTIDV